jgi:hypothetical protein
MEKEQLINKILQACKVNNVYIDGELFFSLAFCSVSALKKIARELYIKV